MARFNKSWFEVDWLASTFRAGETGQIRSVDRRRSISIKELLERLTTDLEKELAESWPTELTEEELRSTPIRLTFHITFERKLVNNYGK
jgi:hypothetical protein